MATGQDLINAILANETLMNIDNCPLVSVVMGEAIYGKIQNDGEDTIITTDDMQKAISTALTVNATASENVTALWHFMTEPTHHFVIIPWYHSMTPYWVFTVFMAYEHQYTVRDYVTGTAPAPATRANGGLGYQNDWSYSDISTMLSNLLTEGTTGLTAWQDYFGNVDANQATQITYWKYDYIAIETAIANVNAYTS